MHHNVFMQEKTSTKLHKTTQSRQNIKNFTILTKNEKTLDMVCTRISNRELKLPIAINSISMRHS